MQQVRNPQGVFAFNGVIWTIGKPRNIFRNPIVRMQFAFAHQLLQGEVSGVHLGIGSQVIQRPGGGFDRLFHQYAAIVLFRRSPGFAIHNLIIFYNQQVYAGITIINLLANPAIHLVKPFDVKPCFLWRAFCQNRVFCGADATTNSQQRKIEHCPFHDISPD